MRDPKKLAIRRISWSDGVSTRGRCVQSRQAHAASVIGRAASRQLRRPVNRLLGASRKEVTVVQYDEFIRSVAQGADIPWQDAERLTAATLQTLAERITGGEANDLAAQLPLELKPHLTGVREEAEQFDVDTFVARVADRDGTDPDQALAHVGAVFATLREAVTAGELDDVAAQLPDGLRDLVGFH
jgi:uncharacterized protein (DUF2267 family)